MNAWMNEWVNEWMTPDSVSPTLACRRTEPHTQTIVNTVQNISIICADLYSVRLYWASVANFG